MGKLPGFIDWLLLREIRRARELLRWERLEREWLKLVDEASKGNDRRPSPLLLVTIHLMPEETGSMTYRTDENNAPNLQNETDRAAFPIETSACLLTKQTECSARKKEPCRSALRYWREARLRIANNQSSPRYSWKEKPAKGGRTWYGYCRLKPLAC
jgi:hypothetical protein